MSRLPFIDLNAQYQRIKSDVDARIASVVERGQFIMGSEVAELEERLAHEVGAPHCVAVSSGTDALLAPLLALGVGPGDAVFMPSFTFTATAEVAALLGATPVFVEVDEATYLIDPSDLERQIAHVREESSLTGRAVIGVDLFGLPAPYPRLAPICEREGLVLIADAAQSIGGRLGNARVGALAPITATSFFPAKPLGCFGDGGAVFTHDAALADAVRSIRAHGKGSEKYAIERIGLNARLDTIQAAVLLAKLDIFEDELAARQRIAALYAATLSSAVQKPVVPDGAESAWALYTIQSDRRDAIQSALRDAGIPSVVYYPRGMHQQPAYRDRAGGSGDYAVTERLTQCVLSVPFHPYLADADLTRICAVVNEAVGD